MSIKDSIKNAIDTNDLETLREFSKSVTFLHIQMDGHLNPLHYAIKENKFYSVRLLVDKQHRLLQSVTESGKNILQYAVSLDNCNVHIVEYLMQKCRKEEQIGLLRFAMERRYPFNVCNHLLRSGIDINEVFNGYTILNLLVSMRVGCRRALNHNSMDKIKFLLNNGADTENTG